MDKVNIINSNHFIISDMYKSSHSNMSIDIMEMLCKHNILDLESIKYIEILDNNEIQTLFTRDTTIIKLHTKYIDDKIKLSVIVNSQNICYDYVCSIGDTYTRKEGLLEKAFERLIKDKDKI